MLGFLVDEYTNTRGSKTRCGVEIEGAKDLGVSRQLGISARSSTQEVQRDDGLRYQAIPQTMQRKMLVHTAEPRNEVVVLEGADGTFREIASMHAGRDELLGDVLVARNCFGAAEHSLSRCWRIGLRPELHRMVVWRAL